jgi:hypothetical protein
VFHSNILLRVNEVKRFVYNRADIYKKFNLLDDYRKEEITCILDEQVNWVIENEPQEHKYALKALYWEVIENQIKKKCQNDICMIIKENPDWKTSPTLLRKLAILTTLCDAGKVAHLGYSKLNKFLFLEKKICFCGAHISNFTDKYL